MHVDLVTLYLLAIGTLLVSAGMMFWEHRTNPCRSKELRILAAGFVTLAIGCVAVLYRRALPGPIGSAAANLVMLTGYLVILRGVASFSGRRYRAGSIGLLIVMALIWAIGGGRWREEIWSYVSALPIALISGMTAWEMLRCDAMKTLPSRHVVVAAAALHAALYAFRAFILPWLVMAYGPVMRSVAGKITIYEGVLYSVALPMALLKLMREETHARLLRESQTDYLTRLGNRRWFFEEASRVISSGERYGAVAVLAFDLDQFKAINDQYGHYAGDQVLKSFAEAARNVVGAGAILARIGGEEFAALLTGDEALRARALGEAIAARFSETVCNQAGSIGIPATVSIGLARFENEAPALVEALAVADRALYRAKSLGGNRLEIADPPSPAAARA
jgi:diguanylate cyclase (GGDEF)-like protein